ncbi:MAG TPA: UDP-glucose 4-epimerase GalE [Candidatus Nitrosotenuis sp.]|nr:UDP-glucose 4-epimerase GalE [Candidatus Nitrosotenuis sp.]
MTGGAGYVGSHVAADLVRHGYHVVVLDNFSRGHRQAVPPEAEVVRGDLADRPLLASLLGSGGFTAVLHFAAFIEAGESMQRPERYFRNNTANTLGLLECMLEAGVERLVFSSTAALYGEPRRLPIDEEDPLQPTNAYGESKLMVERMLDWFHRIHGLRYASLRYFNAAGATPERGEDHYPETHLIPRVLAVAQGREEQISVFGTDYPTRDGTCIRDYIHVADLASAHLLALEALKSRDRLIYNLGNGRGFTVREVIETARRVTGRPIAVRECPRRPGDPVELVAGSDRIRRELGWVPRHPDLEAIIASAWEWRLRHPQGYGPPG